jgi:MSHA biogenesis protein MshK
MADHLMRFCALLLLTMPALAQGLPPAGAFADPTRPPASVIADPASPAGETGPVLQSVIIPKKGKPVAIIGGQQVTLGGKYGDSRLIALSEREAVLEGPGGIEHLRLTPGIEKTNIIAKTPGAKRAQSKGKP